MLASCAHPQSSLGSSFPPVPQAFKVLAKGPPALFSHHGKWGGTVSGYDFPGPAPSCSSFLYFKVSGVGGSAVDMAQMFPVSPLRSATQGLVPVEYFVTRRAVLIILWTEPGIGRITWRTGTVVLDLSSGPSAWRSLVVPIAKVPNRLSWESGGRLDYLWHGSNVHLVISKSTALEGFPNAGVSC